jgi:hypothetical protein
MRGSINAKVEVVYAKARSRPQIQGRHRQCTNKEIVDTWTEMSGLGRGRGMALLAAEDGARATLVTSLVLRVVLLGGSSRADRA